MKTKKFMQLFTGLPRAYGQFVPEKGSGRKGKVEGKFTAITKQITEKQYKAHLDGEVGLAVVPIRDDATCLFGCIDVDVYEDSIFADINKTIQSLELPLVMCRSKSGGAHLYLFCKEPIPAPFLILKLNTFAKFINYNTEIFPKQSSITKKNTGSFLNLPYYGGTRFALGADLKELGLDTFLAMADNKAITNTALKKWKEPYNDVPPCIQKWLITETFPAERNTVLFNMAVLLRRKNIETWRERILDFNERYFGLSNKELMTTINRENTKDYYYQCNNSILKENCRKEECIKRTFGHQEKDEGFKGKMSLDSLQKLDTNPPMWFLNINNKRIKLTSEDLLNQRNFQKCIMEKLMIVLPLMKQSVWEDLLNEAVMGAEIIEAPEDANPAGTLLDFVEEFCLNRAPAKNKDELLRGRPWTNDGYTYFRSASLKEFLKKVKFFDLKSRDIWDVLRNDRKAESIVLTLKGKSVRVWKITAFDEQTEEFDLPEKEKEPF